jgi:DNA polymerase-3 subunit delta'
MVKKVSPKKDAKNAEAEVQAHRPLALPLPWQADAWQRLQQARQQQRFAHALLLTGVPGIGKARFAEALAQSLLCQTPDPLTGYACGECRHCVLYQAGNHPDCYHLGLQEKSRQIKIDQIREWVASQAQTAHLGAWKIAIIEPAEQMNTASANALLKCLEEPTPGTLLILISAMPGALLPTVRSRCQHLPLSLPSNDVAQIWLQQQVGIDAQQAARLFADGEGPLLVAQSYLDGTASLSQEREQSLQSAVSGQLSLFVLAEQWQAYALEQNLRWLEQRLAKLLRAAALADNVPAQQKPLQRGFALWRQLLQWRQQVQAGANPNIGLFMEHLLGQYLDVFRRLSV